MRGKSGREVWAGLSIVWASVVAAAVLVGGLALTSSALTLDRSREQIRQMLGSSQASPPVATLALVQGSEHAVLLGLQVQNMEDLGAFDFQVSVGGGALRIVEAQGTDFLGSSGRTAYPLGPRLAPDGSSAALGAYTVGTVPGVSGSGTLATVALEVKKAGVVDLWVNNALLVTASAELIPTTAASRRAQVRRLHPGWNLLGFCVDGRGQTVDDLLLTIRDQYTAVLDADNQPASAVGVSRAAWVRIEASQPVTVTTVGGRFDAHTSLDLAPGWHLITYCGTTPFSLPEALQSIEGKYDRVIGLGGAYMPELNSAYATFNLLTQGESFLIHLTEAGRLRFPVVGGNPPPQNPPLPGCPEVAATPYATLLYGRLTLDGHPAAPGTLVEALTPRGEVAGCTVVENEGRYGLMVVYGADEEGDIPGFREAEPMSIRVGSCQAEIGLGWIADRAPHQADIALSPDNTCVVAARHRLYLPFVRTLK